MSLTDHDRVCRARELTAGAGYPLRDRYGFAARDSDVMQLIKIVTEEPDDAMAGERIGIANALEEIQIAMAPDTPADEEYELGIVRALRALPALP